MSVIHRRRGSGPAIEPAGPNGFFFLCPILLFCGLAAPAAP